MNRRHRGVGSLSHFENLTKIGEGTYGNSIDCAGFMLFLLFVGTSISDPIILLLKRIGLSSDRYADKGKSSP